MDGSGDTDQSLPSDLLREITELKRSNQRLERAFVALSQILENQQHLLNELGTSAPNAQRTELDPSSRTRFDHDALRTEFERKLKRSRSSIVKEKIIAHLSRSGPTERSELKFLFVDQLRYTSKASFYRYVSDLASEGALSEADVNGRVIVSLATVDRYV